MHYCKGLLKTTFLYASPGNETLCGHDAAVTEARACCAPAQAKCEKPAESTQKTGSCCAPESKSAHQDKQVHEADRGCCHDEYRFIRLHDLFSVSGIQVNTLICSLPEPMLFREIEAPETQAAFPPDPTGHPPDRLRSAQLLFGVFRI